MSVTPETHQPAMAPYFAVAASSFELYSVTAVCREALSAKVEVQAGGGGEGGGGEGEGGGGEGEGDGRGEQNFALHLWHLEQDFFSHLMEHLFFAASTPLARSTEIRSIMRETMFCAGREGWMREAPRCAQVAHSIQGTLRGPGIRGGRLGSYVCCVT